MQSKPKLFITATRTDLVFDRLGWLLIAATWIFAFYHYPSLPEIIPTHYNFTGEANAFGNKIFIFTLPLIASIVYTAMTVMTKYPRTFNYPVKITPENALRQYTLAAKMIRYLKLIIVIIFCYLILTTTFYPQGSSLPGNKWFLPMSLVFIFIPLIVYIIYSVRQKKKE
jgi:uncharacterized membrane protein